MIESRLVCTQIRPSAIDISLHGLSEVREDGMFGPVLGLQGRQNDLVLCTAIQLKTIAFIVRQTKYDLF